MSKIFSPLIAPLLGALFFGGFFGNASAFEKEYQAYFDDLKESQEFFGCIIIESNGEKSFSDCHGRDVDGRPLTFDTLFQIASVSKQFTAAATLILAEEGILDLDDLASYYVPELTNFETLTVRNLLNNSGGVANNDTFKEYFIGRDGPVATAEILGLINERGPNFPPGSSYEYTNFGWRVLAIILERSSGQNYPEILRTRLFAPLKMDSSFALKGEDFGRVNGFDPSGKLGKIPVVTAHSDWLEGAGTIVSTPNDMIKWQRALYNSQVLSQLSFGEMTKPVFNEYGMGLSVYEVSGGTVFGHDGRLRGWASNVMYREKTKTHMVFLSNYQSRLSETIRGDVGRISRGEEARDPYRNLVEANFDENSDAFRWQGIYVFSPAFKIRVIYIAGKLFAAANFGDYTELAPKGEDTYVSRALLATISFKKNEQGDVVMNWAQNGGAFEGRRILDAN